MSRRECLVILGGAICCHVLLLAQPALPQAAANVTAIRAGALFDGTRDTVVKGATILVRDGQVAEVGTNVSVPNGTDQIALSAWTVMPGFIDLHTHITSGPEDLASPPGSLLYTEYPEYPVLGETRHIEQVHGGPLGFRRQLGEPPGIPRERTNRCARGDQFLHNPLDRAAR